MRATGLRSRRLQAFLHRLDGRLRRAGAKLFSECARFADRLINGGFVVIMVGAEDSVNLKTQFDNR